VVAQPIARCGEAGGIGRGRQVAQRGMRALVVVVVDPISDLGPGVIVAEEQGFVEKLVAHFAVEALAKAVLHRLVRRDEVPCNFVALRLVTIAWQLNSVPLSETIMPGLP
jgi:hypothetical protein